MKILQLIPRFTVGGAERLALEYAKRLPAFGFSVTVASVRGGGELVEDYRLLFEPESQSRRQTTDYRLLVGEDGWVFAFFHTLKRLRAYVREGQPDIIHTHIFSSDVAGYLLKRWFPQIKWISAQHNVARQHSWWRQLVLRHILRRADRVIAVSPRVAHDSRSRFGVSEERLALLPNGIALAPWLVVEAAGLLSSPTLRLATIGRLTQQKGQDILLRALARVPDIAWQLDIFGEGEDRQRLESLVQELGLQERVRFHGAVDDLPKRLQDIDVVVAPSRWEGMSLTVMEAMAAGRVIIASNPAGEGLIEDMKTGIIIKAECRMQNAELVDALRWVGTHRMEAKTMAENARQHATEYFGIEKHLQMLTGVYCELCDRN